MTPEDVVALLTERVQDYSREVGAQVNLDSLTIAVMTLTPILSAGWERAQEREDSARFDAESRTLVDNVVSQLVAEREYGGSGQLSLPTDGLRELIRRTICPMWPFCS